MSCEISRLFRTCQLGCAGARVAAVGIGKAIGGHVDSSLGVFHLKGSAIEGVKCQHSYPTVRDLNTVASLEAQIAWLCAN